MFRPISKKKYDFKLSFNLKQVSHNNFCPNTQTESTSFTYIKYTAFLKSIMEFSLYFNFQRNLPHVEPKFYTNKYHMIYNLVVFKREIIE